MAASNEPNKGSAADAGAEVARVVRRFEDAWQKEAPPALEAYLPDDAGLRTSALVELIQTDLQHRLKAGEPARVETYLERYPELKADRDKVLALLAAEYEGRRHRESGHSLKDYERRFPHLRGELS